jgi:hypothetical protein
MLDKLVHAAAMATNGRQAVTRSKQKVKEFEVPAGDPLADEHAAVTAWIGAARAAFAEQKYYDDLDLKSLPSGRLILESSAEQARRYLLAALAQLRHWDSQADAVCDESNSMLNVLNPQFVPLWDRAATKRHQAEKVIGALLRRNLPLEKGDLLDILEWCNRSTILVPPGHIVRALKRFASESTIDDELREPLQRFATQLRAAFNKDTRRLGTDVEQLYVDAGAESAPPIPLKAMPVPKPEPAGDARVLSELKRFLGLAEDNIGPPGSALEPDQFHLPDDSPLQQEHKLVSAFLEAVIKTRHYDEPDLSQLETGRTLLDQGPSSMTRFALAAAEQHIATLLTKPSNLDEHRIMRSSCAAAGAVASLLQAPCEPNRQELFDLLLYLSVRPRNDRGAEVPLAKLFKRAQEFAAAAPLTEGERYVLWLCRATLVSGPPFGSPSAEVKHLSSLIKDGANFYLAPGEAWSDALNHDIANERGPRQQHWRALLKHMATLSSARPSERWLQTADELADALGGAQVRRALARWLPLVAQGQTIRRLRTYVGDSRGGSDLMNEENATCLRGLLWLVHRLPEPDELARAVTAVAQSAYRKVPGVGPWAVKVGNAAVFALAQMTPTATIGQLAILKVRVKFGTAQKEIEKAFNQAAEKLGLAPEQIEEMGVPSYGLQQVGLRRESLGDYRAELIVTGTGAELKWADSTGKALKAVPARVKSEHKEDWNELQQALKDIKSMLPAQRDRLDSLFLLQKNWPIEVWRERYLNHPLVGTIARRLLWCVDRTAALFLDGSPTDVGGAPIAYGESAEISLWHPVGRPVEEITSWRERLETLEITQPFKQAHREVYLLTDAERKTESYSNRFAAHIIRQHQFHALCGARRWKNKLRLLVDDAYPPASKVLPYWGLRAEFWIEGAGQDYRVDTNDSGAFLRLATDQVRFYQAEAEQNLADAYGGGYGSRAAGPGTGNINKPIPLEQVPPLVFSEIMRDVDLFVGVSSVGNDPTWQDGGPGSRYLGYWQSYAFGELSGTATMRKQVLERLIPRLRIAKQCSLSDRFLIVRGEKRTYKIHLGSGNILMGPNDQYLCIVPDSRSRMQPQDLFLPFEGDNTLSIIISKALLLAEDSKIKDPTISRQIKRR